MGPCAPVCVPADKGAGRDSFRAVPGVRVLAPCKGKAEATPLTWCRCGPVPADLLDSASVWAVPAGAAFRSVAVAMCAQCLDVNGLEFKSITHDGGGCYVVSKLHII